MNAYKLSTNETRVVEDTDNVKKVIVVSPATTVNITNQDMPYKIIPLIYEHNTYGEIRQDTVKTLLKYKFNQTTVIVTEYRSLTFPCTIKSGSKFELDFALSCPNGENISASDPAFLSIHYDENGKLQKLSIPALPVLCQNPYYPVLIGYHNKLCIIPINSGHYEYLIHEINKNHGVIKIGHADSAYHIEAIY